MGENSDLQLVTSGLAQPSFLVTGLKSLTTYYWKVIAQDSHNAFTESPVLSFTTGNTPPLSPTGPSPAYGTAITYDNVYLSWNTAEDPDPGDSVSYDVYFGTSPTPPLLISNTTETSYTVGALDPAGTYYWKIVAKDNHGAATEGPVWSFTTIDHTVQNLQNVTYSTDTTLTRAGGPYLISGQLKVDQGVTLTIEPGTVLKFQANAYLTINGTLHAIGSAGNNIVFTSYKNDRFGGDTNADGNATSPSPGDWGGIRFANGSDGSSFEHCIVEYAGSSGGIYVYQASPTIKDSIIRYSSSYGIRVQGGAPVITGNTFADCANYGIYVSGGFATISGNIFTGGGNYDIWYQGTADGVITGNTTQNGIYVAGAFALADYSGNTITYNNSYPLRVAADDVGRLLGSNTLTNIDGDSYIEVTGGTVTRDATWPATITYHVLGSITVQGTDGADQVTTLTIAAGARLRFNRGAGIVIGSSNANGAPGALVARGTSEHPILLTSALETPAAGDWNGLTFYTTTDDASTVLEHCIIEYAGSSGGIYVYQASPTIKDSIIRYSSSYGIRVQGGAPVITGDTFADNGNYDLYFNGIVSGVIIGNSFNNGVYAPGSGTLTFSSNTFNYNNNFPPRIMADNVGVFTASSTFNNAENGFIEVVGSTITRDATWPASISVVLRQNVWNSIKSPMGAAIRYIMVIKVAVFLYPLARALAA